MFCNTSLSNWLSRIDNPNLLPFQKYNEYDEPFDTDNPEIEITFSHLKGRTYIKHLTNVFIQSQAGETLFIGKMYNGKLKQKINAKIASHPAWRSRLIIGIADAENSPTEIFIHGSFKNGKLDGLIQIYGQMTTNPKGHCSYLVFPGLSFFGWYENGKPTGLCWRRLKGPTYLYGIVDDNGDFTGDDISFIYQDLETALVGKFDKGIMVRLFF